MIANLAPALADGKSRRRLLHLHTVEIRQIRRGKERNVLLELRRIFDEDDVVVHRLVHTRGVVFAVDPDGNFPPVRALLGEKPVVKRQHVGGSELLYFVRDETMLPKDAGAAVNLGPVPRGFLPEILAPLPELFHHGADVGGELLLVHLRETLALSRQKGLHAGVAVVGIEGVALDQHEEVLDVAAARLEGGVDDVPERLLAAQLVEGRFVEEVLDEDEGGVGGQGRPADLVEDLKAGVGVVGVELAEPVEVLPRL
mmetsp:Transcript_28346/g.64838  ORF Transcript_28346/g.64838 Transcript_28346/m.64838 type:complete len:256 (-) Transcript_28346:1616-2383(-)